MTVPSTRLPHVLDSASVILDLPKQELVMAGSRSSVDTEKHCVITPMFEGRFLKKANQGRIPGTEFQRVGPLLEKHTVSSIVSSSVHRPLMRFGKFLGQDSIIVDQYGKFDDFGLVTRKIITHTDDNCTMVMCYSFGPDFSTAVELDATGLVATCQVTDRPVFVVSLSGQAYEKLTIHQVPLTITEEAENQDDQYTAPVTVTYSNTGDMMKKVVTRRTDQYGWENNHYDRHWH